MITKHNSVCMQILYSMQSSCLAIDKYFFDPGIVINSLLLEGMSPCGSFSALRCHVNLSLVPYSFLMLSLYKFFILIFLITLVNTIISQT